jgi:hypothetical protein
MGTFGVVEFDPQKNCGGKSSYRPSFKNGDQGSRDFEV